MKKTKIAYLLNCVMILIVFILSFSACTPEGSYENKLPSNGGNIGISTDGTHNNNQTGTDAKDEWKASVIHHWHEKVEDEVTYYEDRGPHDFGNGTVCSVCGYQVKESEGLDFALCEDGNSYRVIGVGSNMDKDVVIPLMHEGKPVTELGEGAFDSDNYIETLTTLHNLTTIKKYATRNSKIETLNLQSGLRIIETSGLFGSNNLVGIYIKEGLETIGRNAFGSCNNLETITLPNSVKRIEELAFSSCRELKYVTLGEGLEYIGGAAFSSCSALDNINYVGTRAQWNQIEKGTFRTNGGVAEEWWKFGTVICSDGRLSV